MKKKSIIRCADGWFCHFPKTAVAINLALAMVTSVSLADEPAKSADEIAKELSNPAGSLASLNFNLQYQTFKGDLPDADDQHSWSMIFQPTLPFPVGDQGRKFIFRPAVPVLFDQPVFDAGKGSFDDADLALGDITFDLVYAGNDMKTKKTGYLWGVGGAGTLPTATDADVAGKQWRLGPELFGGVIREWGLVGGLVSNQWNIGGWDDASYSVMTAQYFYAYGLGKGWQITSSPVITYNWHADSDQALTLPLGIGVSKTTKLGEKPWKFAAQVQYFVEQPDAFGPDWLLKFTVTPVVQNKLAGLFK
ncbi:MAG: hypothetical protein WBN81_17315 [Gammaproteobacteria bacterium]